MTSSIVCLTVARERNLANAPITEAIIDFRVKHTQGFQVEKFLTLKAELASEFPIIEPRTIVEGAFEIKVGERIEAKKREELQGYWFKSTDGLSIAQFRSDGFTFNRLRPYTSWEEIFPKAWRLWQFYAGTGAAEFVTRIATRFVNRLTFRTPVSDLSTYLTAPPRGPEGISANIAGFLTRVVIEVAEKGLTSNITQALEKGVDPSSITVILDIDAYRQKQFDVEDKSLFETFDGLRKLKNDIFFNSITEETARLLE